MEIIVRPLSALKRRVRVTFGEDEIQSKFDKEVSDLAAEAHLHGFRKGKVPTRVIEQRYGSKILTEIHNETVRESVDQAIEQENLKVLHVFTFDVTSEPNDRRVEYHFDALVRPKLDLSRFENLRVSKPKVTDFEESVEQEANRLLRSFADCKEVDRPAQLGDKILITSTDLGTEFYGIDSGSASDRTRYLHGAFEFVLGDEWGPPNRYMRLLRHELIGRSVGDEFEVDWGADEIVDPDIADAANTEIETETDLATVIEADDARLVESPENSAAEKGKSLLRLNRLHLKVELKKVTAMDESFSTEEVFAREDVEFNDRDELIQSLRDQLTRNVEMRSKVLLARQIYTQFTKMNPVDIPQEYFETKLVQLQKESNDDDELSEEEKTPLFKEWRHELFSQLITEQWIEAQGIVLDRAAVEAQLRVDLQRHSNAPETQELVFSKAYQQAVQNRVLEDQVLADILAKINLEEDSWSYYDLINNDLGLHYDDISPKGGPFIWEPSVAQEAIEAALRIERELKEAALGIEKSEGQETEVTETTYEKPPKKTWKNWFSKMMPFGKRATTNE